MSNYEGTRFEGVVLTKLATLEERSEELLGHVRAIEGRCHAEHADRAALSTEVRALREKTDFNARVIWGAVTWVALTAAGTLLATLKAGS